jgi:hypothetical protein
VEQHFEELIDFREMLVERLEGDKDLLNRLFLEAGSVEFRFIVRSGLYFGFLFGIVQLVVWAYYPGAWVLPAFGALVGFVTNWLAINIIFRPLRPVRLGFWTVQGVFLKRQQEVAAVWCRLVTTEILTIQRIVYAMLYGSRSERTRELIRQHIQPIADEVASAYRPVTSAVLPAEALDGIRNAIGEKAVAVSTDPFDHWPFIENRSRLVEHVLVDRMKQMSPEEFQNLLRPCFQEDEWKLILAGAVLGLLAGFGQLFFVFGGV